MAKGTCTYPGCDSPHKAHGWCQKHWRTVQRWGTPDGPPPVADLPGERWLPVVGWEKYYKVSDFGRVKSVPHSDRLGHRCYERLLGTTLTDRHPYPRVGLAADGRHAIKSIHGLVMEAFVGPCPEGMEVCHWDGDPANSRLDNLRYDTHEGNMHDKRRHGTDYNANKTHCPHGHEYTPENTYLRAHGRRLCRTCYNLPGRNWNGSKTHCPQGHPYNEQNTYIRPSGSRECRTCLREHQRDLRERRKAFTPA